MDDGGPTRGAPLRLSLMMFMQYAAWGIWLPYLASYLDAPRDEGGLGFSGNDIGLILGVAGSVGAIFAPFLAGQVADRFMNAERYLGILLILGGIFKFSTAYAESVGLFLALSTLYSIVYMPTLALTNSIAFAHLRRPESGFPLVRVWGTIGWIVASNAFPLIWLQTNLERTWLPPFFVGDPHPEATSRIADCMKVGGVIAVCYGVWAMTMLPRTPPTKNARHPLAFLEAITMLRHPGFLIVTLAALPISMIHQIYFMRTSPFLEHIGFETQYVGPIMSIGQFSEIFFLAILGLLIRSIGFRGTLVLGCAAYFLRFAVFAIATEETRQLVLMANALHGLCYGCFFAGAYIFVEKVSPPDIRHSAQTVFATIILGGGPILAGTYFNGFFDRFTDANGAQQYGELWWTQACIGLVTGVFVLLLLREPTQAASEESEA